MRKDKNLPVLKNVKNATRSIKTSKLTTKECTLASRTFNAKNAVFITIIKMVSSEFRLNKNHKSFYSTRFDLDLTWNTSIIP